MFAWPYVLLVNFGLRGSPLFSAIQTLPLALPIVRFAASKMRRFVKVFFAFVSFCVPEASGNDRVGYSPLVGSLLIHSRLCD